MPHVRRSTLLFCALWLFIIVVSVIDGYLVVRHRQYIHAFERNPVGRKLIEWNHGRVWYLLVAKFSGTVIACAALLLIRQANERVGTTITVFVAAAQLGLLVFLVTA